MKEKPTEEEPKKKQLDVQTITILFNGKIVFMIMPYIPMSRSSVNVLKRTLGPILAKQWPKLLDEIPGVRRARIMEIVEKQMGRNDPRFSLVFPDAMSMMEINKNPA